VQILTSVNPATEETISRLDAHSDAEVTACIERASSAQKLWRKTSIDARRGVLLKLAERLRQESQTCAALITAEMGKPISESRSEVEKCAVTCEYYAQNAHRLLADEVIASNASDSRVVLDPLGVVLAVMPWNYPLWQALRAAAPALLSGNGLVLKHASNVSLCAQKLGELVAQSGGPAGLFGVVLAPSSMVAAMINHPGIQAITFTGSTPVGRTIAGQAAHALKKQVLELGGSDPFVVLADADIEAAAQAALKARYQNTGQSCISAKRFIVEAAVADAFASRLQDLVQGLACGDPTQAQTQQGPMARDSLRQELHQQIEQTLAQGAQRLAGGQIPNGKGYFYPPTLLDHVSPDMVAAKEETFGPAGAIIRVKNADEAIEVANGTEFGLGAALWSQDVQKAQAMSRDIEAGAVFINGVVASDARLPFGGVKSSGYGRELGVYGLREFSNIKTVWTGPALT
jgi:succinate-semialdehyde dehydrogenase / glutarate-semialdehyde dehydrogenase